MEQLSFNDTMEERDMAFGADIWFDGALTLLSGAAVWFVLSRITA
jgi:hypothetical protein